MSAMRTRDREPLFSLLRPNLRDRSETRAKIDCAILHPSIAGRIVSTRSTPDFLPGKFLTYHPPGSLIDSPMVLLVLSDIKNLHRPVLSLNPSPVSLQHPLHRHHTAIPIDIWMF